MSQTPVAVGLLVCEQLIVEEKTKNITAVNCFSRRIVPEIPPEPFSFAIYAVLTDGLGTMTVRVVISRLDTDEDIYQRSLSFHFANPLQEIRCLLRVGDCSFPIAGAYQVSLFVDRELVANRKLHILKEPSS